MILVTLVFPTLRLGPWACKIFIYSQFSLYEHHTPVHTVHHYKCHGEEDPAVMIRPGHNHVITSCIMHAPVMSPEHGLRGVVVNVRGPDPAKQVQPPHRIEALPPPPVHTGRYFSDHFLNGNSYSSCVKCQ